MTLILALWVWTYEGGYRWALLQRPTPPMTDCYAPDAPDWQQGCEDAVQDLQAAEGDGT